MKLATGTGHEECAQNPAERAVDRRIVKQSMSASDEEGNRELFRQFRFERILNEGITSSLHCKLIQDPLVKIASVLGTIQGQPAILIIEKTAFGENVSSITKETESPVLKLLEHNDIYRWYLASLSQQAMSIKATIIYPATEVHIRKYQKQKRHMVKETPEIYKEHVEKHIEAMKGSRIQW